VWEGVASPGCSPLASVSFDQTPRFFRGALVGFLFQRNWDMGARANVVKWPYTNGQRSHYGRLSVAVCVDAQGELERELSPRSVVLAGFGQGLGNV